MEIKVELFGAFSDLSDSRAIMLELKEGACVADLRSELKNWLNHNGHTEKATLLDASAISTADKILSESEPLAGSDRVAVLPPVCGG
ncbi:MAG: molybdopterin converting factor [Candidatus Dadabacteria bacterium]|nr:MAG: molybdopterin converting factor [Candidatus Dadabacteria bacterium]